MASGNSSNSDPTPRGLSIVIPAYNAAETIVATIDALRTELRSLTPQLEFIVVDDGSGDGTFDVVEHGGAEDVRLLRLATNSGKGMAVYHGTCASRFSAVCFTDADLPFATGSYTAVARRILAGAELVLASRRLPQSEMQVQMDVLGYAARRHFVGVTFNRCVRSLLQLPFRDTQCGLKGFQRHIGLEILTRMRSPRFLFDVEMLVAARLLGVAAEEVPVSIIYRERKTSLRLMRDSALMLVGLLGIFWRRWSGGYRLPNLDLIAPDAPSASVLVPQRVEKRDWNAEARAGTTE